MLNKEKKSYQKFFSLKFVQGSYDTMGPKLHPVPKFLSMALGNNT